MSLEVNNASHSGIASFRTQKLTVADEQVHTTLDHYYLARSFY